MAVKNRPRYVMSAAQLANWLHAQGPDAWWTVDGDPILTGRVSFPSTGPEVAEVLVRLKKRLLFVDLDDPEIPVEGREISAIELDRHVRRAEGGERVLQFSWEDDPETDWLLIEDLETAQYSKQLAAKSE